MEEKPNKNEKNLRTKIALSQRMVVKSREVGSLGSIGYRL